MVHYRYNSSIWEVETRGLPTVRDQPGLQNQKYYLKIKIKTKTTVVQHLKQTRWHSSVIPSELPTLRPVWLQSETQKPPHLRQNERKEAQYWPCLKFMLSPTE